MTQNRRLPKGDKRMKRKTILSALALVLICAIALTFYLI